jgi:hypothetical protein
VRTSEPTRVLHELTREAIGRGLLTVYTAAFLVVGVATLGHGVDVSLDAGRFPARWDPANPSLRAAYDVAFGVARPHATPRPDPDALRVLRRYEPRASRSR